MYEVKLIIGGMLLTLFFWVAPPQNNSQSPDNQNRPAMKGQRGNDMVLEGLVGGFKPYDDDNSHLSRVSHRDDE